MATNASNSNFVSIENLPKAQLAFDEDLLILQTQNGTESITFNNFNVVKTDIKGNATVVGSLTGNDAYLTQLNASNLYVNDLYTSTDGSSYALGITENLGYKNRFQFTNGVIVSSDYINGGSPEYQALYALYRTLSANSSPFYKKVFETSGIATISFGSNFSDQAIAGLPYDSNGNSIGSNLGAGNLNVPGYFTLTPFGSPLPSSVPGLSSWSYNSLSNTLLFKVNLAGINNTGLPVNISWRFVYFYN